MLFSERSSPPNQNRTAPLQVAHHDAVGVPLPNGNLIDADHLGRWRASAAQLLAHVLLLQLFDGVPIEMQFLRDGFDGRGLATPPNVEGEALCVERILSEEVELLLLHLAAAPARHSPNLELQKDAAVPGRKVAHAASAPVVPATVQAATVPTRSFFERR
jgi:hypothetical protein